MSTEKRVLKYLAELMCRSTVSLTFSLFEARRAEPIEWQRSSNLTSTRRKDDGKRSSKVVSGKNYWSSSGKTSAYYYYHSTNTLEKQSRSNINPHQLRNPIRLELPRAAHLNGGAVRKAAKNPTEAESSRHPNGKQPADQCFSSTYTMQINGHCVHANVDRCPMLLLLSDAFNNALLQDEEQKNNPPSPCTGALPVYSL